MSPISEPDTLAFSHTDAALRTRTFKWVGSCAQLQEIVEKCSGGYSRLLFRLEAHAFLGLDHLIEEQRISLRLYEV